MEISVAAPIFPSQTGNAADPGGVNPSADDRTTADRQADTGRGQPATLVEPNPVRPEGSDPALWDTLSAAEQDYFATMESIGSLTYGPGISSSPKVAPLGQRLDVLA
jgi:hypothetical protein